MSLSLPRPPERYDAQIARRTNELLESADATSYKKRQHVEISPPALLILSSPDGTRWSLTVDDAGTVGATAL